MTGAAPMHIRPPSGMAWQPLRARFQSTCRSWAGSARTARSAGTSARSSTDSGTEPARISSSSSTQSRSGTASGRSGPGRA